MITPMISYDPSTFYTHNPPIHISIDSFRYLSHLWPQKPQCFNGAGRQLSGLLLHNGACPSKSSSRCNKHGRSECLTSTLLDAYKAHTKKLARNKKPSLKHWKVPLSVASTWGGDLHERMLKIKLMSPLCKVHHSLISWVVLLVTPHTILSPTVLLVTIHSINLKKRLVSRPETQPWTSCPSQQLRNRPR